MHKCFVLFLCAVFTATTCARSTGLSVFRIPEDLEDNEIDRNYDLSMAEEKQLALETNEVGPLARNVIARPQLTGPTTVEEATMDDSSEEQRNDINNASDDSSGFINHNKAPSTTFEYIKEFLYGLCHWVYEKFID